MLQLIQPSQFQTLLDFVHRPNLDMSSKMRRIPALYQAVTTELRSPVLKQRVSSELLAVCHWLYKRAFREYGLVRNYGFPGIEMVMQRDYLVVCRI